MSMNAMTGKSLSLVEGDEQVAELLDGGEATENDTVATTSSIGAEQSTSAHHNGAESDVSTEVYSPESILPDLQSESAAEDEEIHVSDKGNDERPVIKRGKKWRKKIPIQILGNPISPLTSPPSTSRYLREDEYPPPPKRGTPMRDAWWKLCEKDYEIEENYTKNENHKRGKHGRRLSIYNSNKEVEGPACYFCCHGGLIYISARKYCAEIRDESDSDEASQSEEILRIEKIETVIKQELEAPLAVDNKYAEEPEWLIKKDIMSEDFSKNFFLLLNIL